jgi:predicted DNA binding protein
MKPGYTIEDIKKPKEMEFLDILKVKGQTYTILAKMTAKRKGIMAKYYDKIMKFATLDVIYDLPYHISEEKLVLSCIGESKELEKALKAFKFMGKVKRVSFQKATFQEKDPLAGLTDKQKEIVLAAKKKGYYDYPRKVKAEEVANELGISKATAIEHLRKAENRIMEQMLAGY